MALVQSSRKRFDLGNRPSSSAESAPLSRQHPTARARCSARLLRQRGISLCAISANGGKDFCGILGAQSGFVVLPPAHGAECNPGGARRLGVSNFVPDVDRCLAAATHARTVWRRRAALPNMETPQPKCETKPAFCDPRMRSTFSREFVLTMATLIPAWSALQGLGNSGRAGSCRNAHSSCGASPEPRAEVSTKAA